MTPIGRIFTVLNLALAAGFVYSAGIYYQAETDWKQQFNDLKSETDTQIELLNAQVGQLGDDNATINQQLTRASDENSRLSSENQTVKSRNETLQSQLSAMEGNLTEVNNKLAGMAQSIDRAVEESNSARAASIAATQAQNSADRAKVEAEGKLSQAENKITDLTGQIGEQEVRIGELVAETRRQDMILSYVNSKSPGLIQGAQPDLGGSVTRVDLEGRMITIQVTRNDGGQEIKAGYHFAIYSGDDYKGEAVVQSVEGAFAFCRVTKTPANASKIQAGDQASTHT